jgi:CheY-like chemotaxis protein
VQEALSLTERLTFDAVLCDLNLRSGGGAAGSGLDLYAALTGAAPDCKEQPLFFFMSGELVAPVLAEQLNQAGARMLQKPFRISDLIAILTEAFAKRVRGRSQLSHVR